MEHFVFGSFGLYGPVRIEDLRAVFRFFRHQRRIYTVAEDIVIAVHLYRIIDRVFRNDVAEDDVIKVCPEIIRGRAPRSGLAACQGVARIIRNAEDLRAVDVCREFPVVSVAGEREPVPVVSRYVYPQVGIDVRAGQDLRLAVLHPLDIQRLAVKRGAALFDRRLVEVIVVLVARVKVDRTVHTIA